MVKIVAGNHIARQILLQLLLSLFVLKNILIYMQAHNITCDIENAWDLEIEDLEFSIQSSNVASEKLLNLSKTAIIIFISQDTFQY